jgi:hypothetical protein
VGVCCEEVFSGADPVRAKQVTKKPMQKLQSFCRQEVLTHNQNVLTLSKERSDREAQPVKK